MSQHAYASILFALSAAIIGFLGVIHLYYTLASERLHPRDRDLRERLETGCLLITRQTTMWKAWIGFNISHSLGAMFFGAVYGYLAVFHLPLLLESPFLLISGATVLLIYLVVAWLYWFKTPFRAILAALALYISALISLFSIS